MFKDYLLIISIITISIFIVEYDKKDKELLEAKNLSIEYFEESESLRLAVNSLNNHLEQLEANIPLLKDLLWS